MTKTKRDWFNKGKTADSQRNSFRSWTQLNGWQEGHYPVCKNAASAIHRWNASGTQTNRDYNLNLLIFTRPAVFFPAIKHHCPVRWHLAQNAGNRTRTSQLQAGRPAFPSTSQVEHNFNTLIQLVWWQKGRPLVGWLVFNGTFSTNGLYCATRVWNRASLFVCLTALSGKIGYIVP